jgi:hypothetical protein
MIGGMGVDRRHRLEVAEQDRLAELEGVVEQGLQTFIEVGEALSEIRASRLYRETHETFETYCRERWGFTGRRARQLMTAAEVGTIVPVENEAQARELGPLLRSGEVELLADVWRGLRERYPDEKLTAERLRSVVARELARSGREQTAETKRTRPRPGLVRYETCETPAARHHQIVAAVEDPAERARLLDAAVQHGWSERDLQDQIKGWPKVDEDPPTDYECPSCRYAWSGSPKPLRRETLVRAVGKR